MIAEACSREKPYDVILVHSQSRFARNTYDLLHYTRKLDRAGVQLISITQDMGESDQADLMRTFMGAMDEYSSKETAKHVSRAMIENAKQGFWNGAAPPFGYRTYDAEKRGIRTKKKIEVAPDEAELVRLMFRLYVFGDGRSGPKGLKSIADYFNTNGYRTRQGRPFRIQFLQKILRNSAYIALHWFNRRDSRAGRQRPPEEWVRFDMPRIVEDHIFQATQDKLDRQHPLKTAPRTVNSNILLTGLAHCGICGAPLRIQTGKSGAYRYYKCAKRADCGNVCSGCSIRMEALDAAVLDTLCSHVLGKDHLQPLLGALIARAQDSAQDYARRLRDLDKERRSLDKQLKILWAEVGRGDVELDPILSAHVKELQEKRKQIIRSQAQLERARSAPVSALMGADVECFADALRKRITDASDPKFARAYLRVLIDRIDVETDAIKISGSKHALAAQAAQFAIGKELVPTFD